MSPSSVAAFAPLQAPLPGPTPQGFSRSPAQVPPNARDAARRLFLSRLPHPHIAGVPKTTLSVLVQWNVTARNSSGAPLSPPKPVPGLPGRPVQARTQTSPCERARDPRGDGDPRLPPSPPFDSPSPTSPKRESRTGRPHPPQDHLTQDHLIGVIIRLSQRGQGREERRAPRPARTPGRRCTGAKAPNASPAFPGPRRPRRPPSLPGLEAGAAAAAAAAAGGGGGRRGSGFVGPGGGGGWCGGAGGGGGGGGRGRRRRVGEAGGRVVPVHRGGCVGRAGCTGGSSRALCMGGGRGGRGREEEEEVEAAAEGAAPSHGPGGRTGGGRAGRSLPGEPGPRRAARPQPGGQGSGGIRGRDSRRRRRPLRPMLVDFPGCTSRPPPPRGLAPPPLGAPRSRLAARGPGGRPARPPPPPPPPAASLRPAGRRGLEACPPGRLRES